MKQLVKTLIVFSIAAVMAFTVITATSAEEVSSEEEKPVYSTSIDDDGSKAYELVWKYKIHNNHLYKRRWNYTLNEWYDPAWILVY